jgi:apolipoprotein N-acyltransferase
VRAVLSGALLFLAFLGPATGPLVWVALVPWLVRVERGEDGYADASRSARAGAALFATFWALNLAWMLVLVVRLRVAWPATAYLGELFLLALLGGVLGAGTQALRRHLPLPVAAALAWVAVEWSRGHLLGPFRFPWSPLALPLVDWLPLVQPAAWVGEAGLGFLVVSVNGLLAVAWVARAPARGREGVRSAGRMGATARPLATAGMLLTTWWIAGSLRMRSADTVGVATVAAIQPAIPLEVKRDSLAGLEAARASLASLLPRLESGGADLVVVPETHFPLTFPDTARAGPVSTVVPEPPVADISAWLSEWSDRLGAPILMGGFASAGGGRENALLVFGSQGVEARYGKVALVPGVEWMAGSGLVSGGRPRPLLVPGRPGPLICIESAWGGLARAQHRAGAGWLLNVTNDGWLAGKEPWTRSPAFRQHPAHMVLRSVETGLGALRVGTTGLTGVISPRGEWTRLLEPHVPGVAVAEIRSASGTTVYARVGDLLGPASLLAMLLGWWGSRRRPR